ncbi:Fumarylacetoacetase [Paraburkholderia piptadeniae]|uniref:fumarylacetoacetase n=1 Tax=Paraburkholderia piptadeniae TaxID=1701573 RepID=A0A1N7RRT7_9BURK|nr:fumarylacetoacetase [Paraburkholderia piptadeniae]SIT37796.1 Fumarylacetoacetase [Paraburkholderia piptadeniae]
MSEAIDHTHNPRARSWVQSANSPNTEFPIQNLPLGVFEHGQSPKGRIGVAIGDQVLDIAAALDKGLLPELAEFKAELHMSALNALMTHGRRATRALRHAVFGLLQEGSGHEALALTCLLPMRELRMQVPAHIGDFTDFFTSIHHARRTGELSRPDMPVAANFRHMPIGYHGRASSVVQSGVPCIRPRGQATPSSAAAVAAQEYLPTQALDFELEVGCLIGKGNALGSTVPIDEAEDHMFGLCLVNDWSARDIQGWESYPLGPFLAKSFMTTVSPWLVTLEALAPFRVAAPARTPEDPPLPPVLTSAKHAAVGAISISLEVLLQTAVMREQGLEPVVLTSPQFSEQYWTLTQMLTHHASNGCNLRTGDLLSSGTVSGVERENSGCMVELTTLGKEPLRLPSGETRPFLEDGDVVWLRGVCRRDGYQSIGFGECMGQIKEGR